MNQSTLLCVFCASVAVFVFSPIGCAPRSSTAEIATSQSATQPAPRYDTTVARPIVPRDRLEKLAVERGADFRLIDRLVDAKTKIPEFARKPLPPMSPDARISDKVALLDESDPFPPREPLAAKEPTIQLGLARSTFRTREREEVLAAIQPFFDLEQRQVNVRPDMTLYEKADQLFYGLLDGKQQMAISHVFDYLLVRSWMAEQEGNGTILLGVARPANPRMSAGPDLPGITGASVEVIVRADSDFKGFGDLKGRRLALTANHALAPGLFLTQQLRESGHAMDQPYFSSVTQRRYPKDAVLDVLKNKADAACVDSGTLGALQRMYGIDRLIRTIAVSPRYHFDVLFTSVNNANTHRTEIELTQRQLNTLKKDPEGQEVLFFFDQDGWQFPEDADLAPAIAAFDDFLTFYEKTPADLKGLLDPNSSIDRQTYDRYGDE